MLVDDDGLPVSELDDELSPVVGLSVVEDEPVPVAFVEVEPVVAEVGVSVVVEVGVSVVPVDVPIVEVEPVSVELLPFPPSVSSLLAGWAAKQPVRSTALKTNFGLELMPTQ